MAKKYEKCMVVSNEKVAKDTYQLEYECDTQKIVPGSVCAS